MTHYCFGNLYFHNGCGFAPTLGVDGKEMGRGLPAHPFSHVSKAAVVPTREPSRANRTCRAGVWILSVRPLRSDLLDKSFQGAAFLCSVVSDRNRLLRLEHRGTKLGDSPC